MITAHRYRSQFATPSSSTLTPSQHIREMSILARNTIFQHDTHMNTLLDYARTRQLDGIASGVLAYSCSFVFSFLVHGYTHPFAALFLVVLLLFLPTKRLLNVYANLTALTLLTLAHYMSTRYVQLELADGQNVVQLDEFVKLERPGFHFLAQV
jgi:hypothetical protein